MYECDACRYTIVVKTSGEPTVTRFVFYGGTLGAIRGSAKDLVDGFALDDATMAVRIGKVNVTLWKLIHEQVY